MEAFVQQVINKGTPWTDPDFPPVLSSLYDAWIDKSVDASRFKSLQWKRFEDVYTGQDPQVFSVGIDPNDIYQGALGDCYFLATLSSLAEFPDRIESMFVTKTINTAGIYMIKFFIDGI
jgi:calpain-15